MCEELRGSGGEIERENESERNSMFFFFIFILARRLLFFLFRVSLRIYCMLFIVEHMSIYRNMRQNKYK